VTRPGALILTPRLPWPLDDGGRIVGWQSVWAAAREYETTLVSLVRAGEERLPLAPVFEEHGVRVIRVAHRPPAAVAAAWAGLFGPWPYTLARYRNPELPGVLRALVAETRPRFALVNHLHMATYAEDLTGVPIVLREHNLEHVWMERYARRLGWTPAGLYARTQIRRLREAETALCRRASLVLAIQEGEASQVRAMAPGVRVEVLPVGVDLGRFSDPHPGEPPVVLLAGSFAWKPNVDGAIQFLNKGWPRVTARVPRARLRVVGKDPPRSVIHAADKVGAEPVGYVESIAEEFARATVFVVPLWAGAGVRVKIVEAMAARVPVVATRLAAEGLGLTAGEHYAAGDTPGVLGGQVATLLLAPAVRAALAQRGRALAEARWSLDAVATLQNSLCTEVASP
jgi:glycosyltransferase involved in cell wall biosynthesis